MPIAESALKSANVSVEILRANMSGVEDFDAHKAKNCQSRISLGKSQFKSWLIQIHECDLLALSRCTKLSPRRNHKPWTTSVGIGLEPLLLSTISGPITCSIEPGSSRAAS